MRKILDDLYYEEKDLGLTYDDAQSTFKVWAPTATEVKVSIYDDAGIYNENGKVTDHTNGIETSMTYDESTGVWALDIDGDLEGKYYMYKLTFADGTTNYAVDPYARAVSANGQRTAIVDLHKTDTESFLASQKPAIVDASDAVIYELHVRDFSIDPNANFEYPGKFQAFTETGLTIGENGAKIGIGHLKELGVTHVHLLPSYDYATVNEMNPDKAEFNWGYDPQNYNVPEGSYSTDATNPTARIEEFKNMVAALHDNGIRVVMDVVYNHTFDVINGPFNKVVPNYYYRTNDDGSYANGSGCGNEVASERPMVRKYIKDSVMYWATEYNLDGFRFDLMGLIDTKTMQEITDELRYEVDADMLVYGEPWQAGGSILPSDQQTLKGSQKGEDFKVFNDEIRGAIKGDSNGGEKGFATGALGREKDIITGVKGAISTIAQEPGEVLTYVTAHDNLNLWDKVVATQGIGEELGFKTINEGALVDGGSIADMVNNADPHKLVGEDIFANETVQRSLLANGIALTAQGVPFIHAGEEILRSKYGDHNSYKSPDELNMIRWELKDRFEPVSDYYAGLIKLRNTHPAFSMETAKDVEEYFKEFKSDDNIVGFMLGEYANGDNFKNIAVIYNANTEAKEVTLPHTANWNVIVDNDQAGVNVLNTLKNTDKVKVAPLSIMVLYDTEMDYEQVPTTIEVKNNSIGLAVGDKYIIEPVVKDQNGVKMNSTVSLRDINNNIIEASGNTITAKSAGSITLALKVGEAESNLTINVVDEFLPTKISLVNSPSVVHEGFTENLTPEIKDQFDQVMFDQKVKWSTSDENVATVRADGTVVGKSEGTVNITATVGEHSATVELSVKPYEKRYVTIDYTREDQDYTDWNLWIWNTGVKDGRFDFVPNEDGNMTVSIEIGPTADNVGFIVRKSIEGNDWSEKDTDADRFIRIPADKTLTTIQVMQGQAEFEILE
ncbi:type I pullulanase [Candidatus Epulonipiscium fishelsonii]|uniref:Type I pullulanase n=1 Tax=Candidatus Epulonipiscium fishelsonii TaxID=77094 RepID=A0ACC8XAF2_9FIRM|nr:type I pullulanase [Epulopiscium sp. SCG-B11WGA-EpuloA1]ONI41152.1 type I pullulanase [Epulopiscium sp. SCG-B05WGA-EpuloA1]